MNNLTHGLKGALEGGGSHRLFRKMQGGLKIVRGRIRRKKRRDEGERERRRQDGEKKGRRA